MHRMRDSGVPMLAKWRHANACRRPVAAALDSMARRDSERGHAACAATPSRSKALRLQIVEPMAGGHHTNYVAALIPAVTTMLGTGALHSAVLTLTAPHRQMLARQDLLPSGVPGLEIDATLGETPVAPAFRDRQALLDTTDAAIERAGADAVLWTTADYDIVHNAARRLTRGLPSRARHRVGAIHCGSPSSGTRSFQEHVKRVIYETAWRGCDLSRLLFVNPLIYEDLRARRSSLMDRAVLLPDPVPPIDRDRILARRALGLPEDGRYIAFVGAMDHRKAIPELCDAFAASSFPVPTRLLLAGGMRRDYRRGIELRHGALLDSGRIVHIDRRLTDAEIGHGFAAADVNAVLQYPRSNLSANVLKAIASNRPAVVDDYGHGGMVVKRFGAGIACDVRVPSTISRALQDAVALCAGYEMTAAARRLVAFHDPANFARTALAAACGTERAACLGSALTWDWVCEGS
jgi:glycosyltransferase involved in cell wall biosynthesis